MLQTHDVNLPAVGLRGKQKAPTSARRTSKKTMSAGRGHDQNCIRESNAKGVKLAVSVVMC